MSGLTGLLNHLRSRLDAEGVPFVIGGAFALAARGHPRFTAGLDVMVLVSDLEPIHRALGPPRFQLLNEVTLQDAETGLLVDVIPVKDDAQRAVFDQASLTPIHGAAGAASCRLRGCV